MSKSRVYFVLGCTACGKGAVGRELARRVGGQIISVDSMKVYRGMDIGTAKPSAEARAQIPHHCIDIVDPSDGFCVAEYLNCAEGAIQAVISAGCVPLAVGGTSLYIKALSSGLFEGPSADPDIRKRLLARAEADGPGELHKALADVDPVAADRIHPNDRKRIIRALEVYMLTGRPISRLQRQWDNSRPRRECLFIGLRRSRDDLHGRINSRVGRMVDAGLKDEVQRLLDGPGGLSPQASSAVGYAEMISHLTGRITLEKAIERIKINTRRLAKKQRTWHRRFPDVQWFDLPPDCGPQDAAAEIMSRISLV